MLLEFSFLINNSSLFLVIKHDQKLRKTVFTLVLIRLIWQIWVSSVKNPKDLDVGSDLKFGSSFVAVRVNLPCYEPFVTVPYAPLQGDN